MLTWVFGQEQTSKNAVNALKANGDRHTDQPTDIAGFLVHEQATKKMLLMPRKMQSIFFLFFTIFFYYIEHFSYQLDGNILTRQQFFHDSIHKFLMPPQTSIFSSHFYFLVFPLSCSFNLAAFSMRHDKLIMSLTQKFDQLFMFHVENWKQSRKIVEGPNL